MLILGYFLALLMGATLGIFGGGGSILTVPILVYVMDVDPVRATAYSLFIVGASSAIGGFNYFTKKQVNLKVGAVFTLPAFLGVYLVRRYLMPSLPETIQLAGFAITKDHLILLVFAVVMILASYFMIKEKKEQPKPLTGHLRYVLIFLEGFVVGGVTGFVGAGGGFLIVPALVLLAGLDIKIAVGTSLIIITFKSLLGFIGDIQVLSDIDWSLLALFSVFSMVGILLGTWLSHKVSADRLKKGFGWFVLVMGVAILAKQII